MGVRAQCNVRFLLPAITDYYFTDDDDMSKTPTTPRSRSRSKRSTTNLSNLRLAPLSTKFAEPLEQKTPQPKSPYEETPDAAFARQHSSYLQGKSAPTTPGILSRSSSRRHLGGGLSRKEYEYEAGNDEEYGGDDEENRYAYAAPARDYGSLEGFRAEMGSGQIPKAKSESVLLAQQRQQRLAGQGVPLGARHRRTGSRRSGNATPRNEHAPAPDDWLTHTGAMASALVQEGKGQTWLVNRATSTAAVPESETDEDDDQYEEMAALSASTANLQLASFDGGSPVSTRVSRWGSRYGSRSASRRTSRIASPVGTRTPRRTDAPGYFDDYQLEMPTERPGFLSPDERKDDFQEQMEIERLGESNSFGLGNFVDRIMNFNLFKGEEGQETTDDETANADETLEDAERRREAEIKRRREEKEKLVSQPPPTPLGGANEAPGEGGGWKDAAWLLSVASKAMF